MKGGRKSRTKRRSGRQKRQRTRRGRLAMRGGSGSSDETVGDHMEGLKMRRCSPKPTKNKPYSCFSDGGLELLRGAWNKKHPKRPIEKGDPHDVWRALRKAMPDCEDEPCWVRRLGLTDQLMDQFAPEAPKSWRSNPNEWLSSEEIENVMKQFERAHKEFKFIGPSPIDYDADDTRNKGHPVWPELANLSVKALKGKGYTKLGIIFNTDRHTGGGQHWFLVFVDMLEGVILCVDSTGEGCPRSVRRLADEITRQGVALSPPIRFRFEQNRMQHQKKGTECGMYSLFFCIHLLRGHISPEHLKTHRIPDDQMEEYRRVYFNTRL